ncbi:hypothetical protein Tco_0439202 [Tanacetum coccineum]
MNPVDHPFGKGGQPRRGRGVIHASQSSSTLWKAVECSFLKSFDLGRFVAVSDWNDCLAGATADCDRVKGLSSSDSKLMFSSGGGGGSILLLDPISAKD